MRVYGKVSVLNTLSLIKVPIWLANLLTDPYTQVSAGQGGFTPKLPAKILDSVDAVLARDNAVAKTVAGYRAECGSACERTSAPLVPLDQRMDQQVGRGRYHMK
jgi:hypothetical protein